MGKDDTGAPPAEARSSLDAYMVAEIEAGLTEADQGSFASQSKVARVVVKYVAGR